MLSLTFVSVSWQQTVYRQQLSTCPRYLVAPTFWTLPAHRHPIGKKERKREGEKRMKKEKKGKNIKRTVHFEIHVPSLLLTGFAEVFLPAQNRPFQRKLLPFSDVFSTFCSLARTGDFQQVCACRTCTRQVRGLSRPQLAVQTLFYQMLPCLVACCQQHRD